MNRFSAIKNFLYHLKHNLKTELTHSQNFSVLTQKIHNNLHLKNWLPLIKQEIVLSISVLLAAVSALFVLPNSEYIGYIDWRTLALLFSLMAVMAGFNSLGLFQQLAVRLLGRVHTVRGLVRTFMLLCFFSSMLITNDVALITFVPFSILTLKLAGEQGRLIYAITLETIAANLGSMLTPIGNPQNLYLFSTFNMNTTDFLAAIDPYATLSLVLLLIAVQFVPADEVCLIDKPACSHLPILPMLLYGGLFVLALLSVFRVVHHMLLLAVVLILLRLFDYQAIKKVDYSLLLTFVFLFIFIGNLGRISSIADFLYQTVSGNEVITAVLASQIFSNVPTAILLSGFTDNAAALLVGVNLGGLGTLIASMASLISFKFLQKEDVSTVKYLLMFTVCNIIFLALNLSLYWITT